MTLIDVLGWIGSFEVLLAYGLNSYQQLRADSFAFYFLNLTGGVLLIIYSLEKGADANAFINVLWVVVAIVGIIRLMRRK